MNLSEMKTALSYYKNNMNEVGTMYMNANDETNDIAPRVISCLKKFTQHLYLQFSNDVCFIFQKDDPYDYLNNAFIDMSNDYNSGKFIKIPSGGDNSKILGNHNLMFRAVHDYIHILSNKSFSYTDEVDTFEYTLDLLSKWGKDNEIDDRITYKIAGIIRSEIIYQSAFKNIDNKNEIDQKVVL